MDGFLDLLLFEGDRCGVVRRYVSIWRDTDRSEGAGWTCDHRWKNEIVQNLPRTHALY